MILNSYFTIQVDMENGYVKIRNDSLFKVEVCEVPKNNKRKVNIQMVIHPNNYWIVDNLTEFDIKNYYFRFV